MIKDLIELKSYLSAGAVLYYNQGKPFVADDKAGVRKNVPLNIFQDYIELMKTFF